MELNPYLSFRGNCRDAINFYKSILGGEFDGGIKTYAEGGDHMKCKPGDEDKIMHVHLKTKDFSILASDNMAEEYPLNFGNNIAMSLNVDENEGENVFNKFLEGGNVIMPFDKVFWGGKFGMLIDQFGIQWMVSTPH